MDIPIKEWLWPNTTSMLISLGTLVVLFIIFKLFLFDKVRAHLNQRQNFIANEIADAESKHKIAQKHEQNAEKQLEEAKVEANTIISDAKVKAVHDQDTMISEAKEEATRLTNENREQIRAEKEAMADDIKREIVEVAFEAAKKVAAKEVKSKDNTKMVDDFINEVGK